MEDFTFSKDYRALWKAARKINNVDTMDMIFDALCNEVGLSDPERDQSAAAAGKEAAERKNARDRGDSGKKI
jgi:hypothetical protein